MLSAPSVVPPAQRRVKGVNVVGLVKLLKLHRKTHPLVFSPAAEALLAEQILVSDWYSFEPFLELVDVTYRELLRRNEASARKMGIVGGRIALSGFHKQFVKLGDPTASLLAMRHTWRVYFDFGELSTERDGARAATFTVEGYPDMTAAHGQMIVGWHVAAAREAGVEEADSAIQEAPWRGAARLVHRVAF